MKSITNFVRKGIFFTCLLSSASIYAQQFAIIGDYRNNTDATAKVAALVKSWKPDFVVTSGDNFDLTAGTIDEQVGRFFSEYIHPYYGQYPTGPNVNRFFPVIGNHELKVDGLPKYLEYFTLPANERYYDFVQGTIHFFMLNGNTSEPDGIASNSFQALWLKKQLELSVSIWNIVVLHQPPYSSGSHGSDTMVQWPFFEWGADAVIAGHDHQFERINKGGNTYFVNGLGGASIYGFTVPIQGSELRFNANYGAQRVFANENELKFQFYTVTDSLVDSFILNRNHSSVNDHCCPNEGIVFPNPSDRYISFTIPITGITFFNSLGQMVFNKQQLPNYESRIEIGLLPKGVYYIRLESPKCNITSRFVKL